MEELLRNSLDDYISVYPTGHFRYLEKYLSISNDNTFKKFIKDIYNYNYYGSDIRVHHPLKLVICKEIQNRIDKQKKSNYTKEENSSKEESKTINFSNLNAQAIEYIPES